AVLFDQCPDGNVAAARQALVECPTEMGISYPCNACWRYWALARLGRADLVVTEFRRRWATMPSVILNNTLQEDWSASPDSTAQWSHCAVAPLYVLFMDIAGIRPTAPGFSRFQVRPQLGDLADLDLTYYTVRGPIQFVAEKQPEGHRISVAVPKGCEAELLLPLGASTSLPALGPGHRLGLKRFRLEAGKKNVFRVRENERVQKENSP
ncbi:MAG: alpha-L-rhamnosidase C-terminal domain-containing protein, partial [Thermoguttaceae bacterium]